MMTVWIPLIVLYIPVILWMDTKSNMPLLTWSYGAKK
mgnify:CR=1 FL=1